MKRVAIGLIIVTVLGGLGTTAFKMVKWGKHVSQSVEVKEEQKAKEEKEKEEEKNITIIDDDSKEEESLNFTSALEFIKSYNKYIDSIGYDYKVNSYYVESARTQMRVSEFENMSIICYEDTSIYKVIIKGRSLKSKLEGYMHGVKAEIEEVGGNTIISNITINN